MCRQWWGYSATDVTPVAIGPDNFFSPLPEDRGQPYNFTEIPLKLKAFSTTHLCNDTLSWTIKGLQDDTSSGRECTDICSNGELINHKAFLGTDSTGIILYFNFYQSNVTHVSLNIPSCLNPASLRMTDCAWPCDNTTVERACDESVLHEPMRFCVNPNCLNATDDLAIVAMFPNSEAIPTNHPSHTVFHASYDCHDCPVRGTIQCASQARSVIGPRFHTGDCP